MRHPYATNKIHYCSNVYCYNKASAVRDAKRLALGAPAQFQSGNYRVIPTARHMINAALPMRVSVYP